MPANTNALYFVTGDTERMRIDSSGNVGIGTSSPSYPLHVDRGATGDIAHFEGQSSTHLRIGEASNVMYLNANNGNAEIAFQSNGSEKMRIDSSGNVGIGTTSPDGPLHIDAATSNPIFTVHKNSTGVSDAVRIRHGRALSGFFGKGIRFQRNDGTEVGSVVLRFTSTDYNTSSDYRLKENVDYEFNALDRVAQLKPARFNFIEEPTIEVDGFLAHEVQDIVPQAVSGEKDAIDDEGNPDYQGIDHSKLVPLLTKAIQEQQTQIDALQSEINLLKGE
jgi:hypothetical protein